MAEPELLVDQTDRLVGCSALFGRDANVRKSEELKHLVFRAPDGAKLILGPAALEGGDDLVLAIPFKGPAQGAEILFEHVDRGAGLTLELILIHIHSALPILFCSRPNLPVPPAKRKKGRRCQSGKLWIATLYPQERTRRGRKNRPKICPIQVKAACPRPGGRAQTVPSEAPGLRFGRLAAAWVAEAVAPTDGPAAPASSASIRARRAAFSSRAATAKAFTVSNSSRLTMSRPPTQSRARSCIAACASRVIPAMVPAAPFITLTRSSNNLFWDCMSVLPGFALEND